MKTRGNKLFVVIPCYNEEEVLHETTKRLKEKLETLIKNKVISKDSKVMYVNDGSKDKTWELIKEISEKETLFTGITLSRNRGHQNALVAGLLTAKNYADIVISMDADLQDPPSLIQEMLKYWKEGYQDVYAKRKTRGRESWLRKKLSMLFYYILEKSIRYEVLKNVGDFRLLDRKCINAIKQLRESERYTKGLFCWIGYRKKEVLFDRGDRIAGQSKWGYRALFNLAIEGIIGFTTAPLRIATLIGMIVAIWALGYMVWIIIKVLIWGDPVAGFPTIMIAMLFLGAVQLIAIGILGEYIGRIFNESKKRPTYLLDQYKGRRQ